MRRVLITREHCFTPNEVATLSAASRLSNLIISVRFTIKESVCLLSESPSNPAPGGVFHIEKIISCYESLIVLMFLAVSSVMRLALYSQIDLNTYLELLGRALYKTRGRND